MHKFLKREKPGTEVAITISANERFVSITGFGEIKGVITFVSKKKGEELICMILIYWHVDI